MMQRGDIAELVLLVSVLITQAIITKPTVSTALTSELCSVEKNLHLYPIIASCLYLICILVRTTNRYNRVVSLIQCFATAMLIAPFVELVIQQCNLAIITYVTAEFCILSLWTTLQTSADLFTITCACIVKMYVYIGYMLMDTVHDGRHVVILYLVLDGAAHVIRTLFAHLKITSTSDTHAAIMLLVQRISCVHFAGQVIVSQLLANIMG